MIASTLGALDGLNAVIVAAHQMSPRRNGGINVALEEKMTLTVTTSFCANAETTIATSAPISAAIRKLLFVIARDFRDAEIAAEVAATLAFANAPSPNARRSTAVVARFS